ncbi:hypothetical protein [Cochleicola gelatinilyticus]|uniref:tRNA (Guanine-N1)-methyltransferase n=1 Tax=Cochleicola gelatinilyticus TaxID=1763537 RepID=A0A167HSE8_9FLAO|nr:hypothetical protein [Cochleicola gelatinilyticus]OAB78916.1 hypothetical protein ULVI_10080 [Cochleicola gelatinilyticus]
MIKKISLTVSLCFLSLIAVAQTETSTDNSLEGQFTDVIDGSNNFQEYKVIKKFKINQLQKNVLDSVAALEKQITTANAEIEKQQTEISSLTETLKTTEEDLTTSKEKEDGIEILGMLTQKATYNTIMWSLILILLAILAFLFYKYKNSHAVTKAANLKLAETEEEFDAHRAKTLEREQQLRRKLQDEINKNK